MAKNKGYRKGTVFGDLDKVGEGLSKSIDKAAENAGKSITKVTKKLGK